MVLVFIFLSILIIISLIITILLCSTIRIQIKNLELGNDINSKLKQYKVKISIKFLNKIPIFWFNLNNKKMKKIYSNKRLEKIDFDKIKNKVKLNKDFFIMLKEFKIKLRSLDLKIKLGTQDATFTSYIIAIIASIISIFLPYVIYYKDINKCKYKLVPLYNNKNEYNIILDSIIEIKIVHITYSMLNFIKKGMRKYERTSNRRSYAYSNE